MFHYVHFMNCKLVTFCIIIKNEIFSSKFNKSYKSKFKIIVLCMLGPYSHLHNHVFISYKGGFSFFHH